MIYDELVPVYGHQYKLYHAVQRPVHPGFGHPHVSREDIAADKMSISHRDGHNQTVLDLLIQQL